MEDEDSETDELTMASEDDDVEDEDSEEDDLARKVRESEEAWEVEGEILRAVESQSC